MAPTKGTQGTKGRKFRFADLREKCKILASVVDTSGVATEAEVRAVRPGSPENPDRGVWGWVHYHANLVAFNARTATRSAAGGTGAEDPEQLILKALRRAPETMEPVGAGTHGVPDHLIVTPKGADALFWFHDKDLLLARLVDALEALRARQDQLDPELEERASGELSYQNHLLAWAACAEGPWLPFDPYREARPELPPWVRALDPRDLVTVNRLFQEVNGGRTRALVAFMPSKRPDGDGVAPRASWSVFASSVAMEMSVPVSTLLRDWTLGELLAQVHVAATAKQDAMDRAREDAARDRED